MEALKQLRKLLQIVYGLVFLGFGFDKFVSIIGNWSLYFTEIFGNQSINLSVFIYIAGTIEIAIGIILLLRPLAGGYLAMLWLIIFAIIFLIGGHFLDQAIRTIVMALGAFVLTQLMLVIKAEEAANN